MGQSLTWGCVGNSGSPKPRPLPPLSQGSLMAQRGPTPPFACRYRLGQQGALQDGQTGLGSRLALGEGPSSCEDTVCPGAHSQRGVARWEGSAVPLSLSSTLKPRSHVHLPGCGCNFLRSCWCWKGSPGVALCEGPFHGPPPSTLRGQGPAAPPTGLRFRWPAFPTEGVWPVWAQSPGSQVSASGVPLAPLQSFST